jgi:hypothetical protein
VAVIRKRVKLGYCTDEIPLLTVNVSVHCIRLLVHFVECHNIGKLRCRHLKSGKEVCEE